MEIKTGEWYNIQCRASELDQGYGKIVTEMQIIEDFGYTYHVLFRNLNGLEDFETVITESQAKRFIENYKKNHPEIERSNIMKIENVKPFECRLQVITFTVKDNLYFSDVEYICVSAVDDEDYMNDCIKAFLTHNQSMYAFLNAIIMPKKTWNHVFQPTIDDIADFNKKLANGDGWNCTDDLQWVKYLGKHCYEFYEVGGPDCRYLYHDTVDVSDFISSEIRDDDDFAYGVNCLRMYGYGADVPDDGSFTLREQMQMILQEVREIYADGYEQVIAEMLFETYFCGNSDMSFASTTDAVNYVMDRINE